MTKTGPVISMTGKVSNKRAYHPVQTKLNNVLEKGIFPTLVRVYPPKSIYQHIISSFIHSAKKIAQDINVQHIILGQFGGSFLSRSH